MRVPPSSVIARLHGCEIPSEEASATESLAEWVTSDGRAVGEQNIYIDARRYGDRIVALITPVG